MKTQEQIQQSPWLMGHPENVVFPKLRKKVGCYCWKYYFHDFFCMCKYIEVWSQNLGQTFQTGAALSEMRIAL